MGSGGMICVDTKFHGNGFRHSSNIRLITATIEEAAVVILLVGGIFVVSC
jgi:hypothetical protein